MSLDPTDHPLVKPPTQTSAQKALYEEQRGLQSTDNPLEFVENTGTRTAGEFHAALASLPAAVRGIGEAILEGVRRAEQESYGLASYLDRIAGDDTLPAEAKVRLWKERAESGDPRRPGLDAVRRQAEGGVGVAIELFQNALESAAMAPLDTAHLKDNREEIRYRLDGAPNPTEVIERILAGPNRQYATVLTTGLGHGAEEGTGGLAEAVLSHIADDRVRASMRDAFWMAAMRGALTHGSDTEKACAAARLNENGTLNMAKRAAAAPRWLVNQRLQAARDKAPQL